MKRNTVKRNTVKRNVSLALGAVLVFGAVPAYAADAVTVNLNGSQMNFDVPPMIENSRTLVPFRKIFEALDSAAAVLASEGKNYHPMVFTRSFEVSLNQDNLLSITQLDYANTYGAHPNTLKSSKTFNLAENKVLTLSEVLGKNAADTDSYVKEKFDAYVKEDVGELLEYYQQNSEKALSAVNFCLTEDALVLYYNPYDILPYAAGSPEVKVPYADTTVKLALSES